MNYLTGKCLNPWRHRDFEDRQDTQCDNENASFCCNGDVGNKHTSRGRRRIGRIWGTTGFFEQMSILRVSSKHLRQWYRASCPVALTSKTKDLCRGNARKFVIDLNECDWSANVVTERAICHLPQVGIHVGRFVYFPVRWHFDEIDRGRHKKGDARAWKFWNLKCGIVGLELADLNLQMTWLRAQQYPINQHLRITGLHAREKHRGEY
jgi:hypothetical protein